MLDRLEAVPRLARVRVHLPAPARLLHAAHQQLVRPEHVGRVAAVAVPSRVRAEGAERPLSPRARAVGTAD